VEETDAIVVIELHVAALRIEAKVCVEELANEAIAVDCDHCIAVRIQCHIRKDLENQEVH